jgi:hypothetical protein
MAVIIRLDIRKTPPRLRATPTAACDEELQQGFATREMGFSDQFARQQSWPAHVRFGSLADIEGL